MGPREWAMLLALSVLWGGSFLFVGVAVKELPPLTLVTLRVSLAAVTLLAVLRIGGIALPREPRIWAALLVMSLLNNVVPFTLIAWGQSHIASGVASIFNATTPLFGVLVAHLWTSDEKATPSRLAGVIVGFAGVTVMMGGAALRTAGVDLLAQSAILIASLCYAVSGVFGRRFTAMGVAPLATAAGMLTLSSLLLLPVALVVDRPWTLPAPSAAAILSVAALALVSTALAYLLYFRILAVAGATNLMLVTFLIPISAIVLGASVLGERLEPKHFVGMALIGLGLAAIDGRLLAAMRRIVSGSRPASTGSG
ncbi:MAG TPA: EamA family transporter [Beijerinckiaceae bacterium]|nr:EamA family transporter [Beijerinckiaceae bacterium]